MTFARPASFTRLSTLAALALALAGCRGDDPGGSATEGSSSSSTGSGTDSASSTSAAPETTGGSTGGSTTDASAGFLTTQGDTSTGGGALPNGAQCQDDSECASGNCYTIPMLGGVCSECKSDQDCLDSGAGISCSLDAGSMQAICTQGGLGTTCESMASCADGLFCAEVIEGTFGLVPTACSECGDSGDCSNGQICSPKVDFNMLSGYKTCVDPGSLPNDELCPNNPEGDAACMSGKCGEVDVMGFIKLGVCGECNGDADCMGGTCTPGSFSQGGVMGSTCG
ncbi:MAG: hypothetical protein H6711_09450 [Myxococcales bacterium]|nr:hypothetical protein [Myxococcales bacterium]